MANIVPTYKKIMCVGCLHGELANPEIVKQVLKFKEKYKPDIRFDLGDIVDTATFRSGARGTPDEGRKVEPDEFATLSWLEKYEPTHLLFGNHDHRLVELQNSPNAIVSYAAGKLWNSINDKLRKLKTKSKLYDFETGAFQMGGVAFIHGFMHSANALRDHAEYFGGPVVMAHLHHAHQVNGRTKTYSPSYCVGTLADIPSMHYARRRRQTATWNHGILWGLINDKKAHLWLATCEKGTRFEFPF